MSLEERLGYRFRDPALLRRALTHRSFAHENAEPRPAHYERLEFLGDALLGLVVSDWLFKDDEEADEGLLSRRRQTVVRTSTLAAAARALALGDELRLGRGEEQTGGRDKSSMLADAFESVLAAVYLDGGVRAARAFVRRHLGAELRRMRGKTRTTGDHKTRFQEAAQAQLRTTPRYRIVSTSGPGHALRFEVEVLVDGNVVGRGCGGNRKQAEQEAALEGLSRLFSEPE